MVGSDQTRRSLREATSRPDQLCQRERYRGIRPAGCATTELRNTAGQNPAPFDNILLSHADRSRIMDEQHRTRVFTVNGIIKPAILVRGKVVGFATVTPAKETIKLSATLFAQQPKTALASIEKEARSLLKFMHPKIPNREVRFTVPT